MSYLEFCNFSAFYKLKKKQYLTVLNNLSFKIEDGEFVAVLGPSGCGKTTLLKAIMGFCEYTEGDILIDGQLVEKLKLNTQTFSYVSQEYSLYPHLTVYENIAFPLRNRRVLQTEIDRLVRKTAAEFQIDFLLTRKPFQLSVGQQQRVALARAFVKEPTLILLDEPFSNQDGISGTIARQLIKKMHENYHVTFILVTHDLDDARYLADKTIIMSDGKITAIGKTNSIMAVYTDATILPPITGNNQ